MQIYVCSPINDYLLSSSTFESMHNTREKVNGIALHAAALLIYLMGIMKDDIICTFDTCFSSES